MNEIITHYFARSVVDQSMSVMKFLPPDGRATLANVALPLGGMSFIIDIAPDKRGY